MLHPRTELRHVNDVIGYGVFATALIPRGTITWVLDPLDRVLGPQDVVALGPAFEPVLERYTHYDGRGRRILCWDFGRFMNHSCDPNCLSPGLSLEIALRDIAVGEQLTNDYGALKIDRDFDCACGAAACRGRITTQDFAAHAAHWDAQLSEAFPDIGRVSQPLWLWVERRAEVRLALKSVNAPSHPARVR